MKSIPVELGFSNGNPRYTRMCPFDVLGEQGNLKIRLHFKISLGKSLISNVLEALL